jgi:integrase
LLACLSIFCRVAPPRASRPVNSRPSEGVAALRAFDLANAYGKFSTSAAYKSFQVACRHLGLAGLRPYDLRHSFLTAVYAATGDLQATATAGDHSTLDLTRRYTLAASDARLTQAIAQFRIYVASQLSAD